MNEKTKDFLNRLNAIGEKIKKSTQDTKAMKNQAEILKNDVLEFTHKFKTKKVE